MAHGTGQPCKTRREPKQREVSQCGMRADWADVTRASSRLQTARRQKRAELGIYVFGQSVYSRERVSEYEGREEEGREKVSAGDVGDGQLTVLHRTGQTCLYQTAANQTTSALKSSKSNQSENIPALTVIPRLILYVCIATRLIGVSYRPIGR